MILLTYGQWCLIHSTGPGRLGDQGGVDLVGTHRHSLCGQPRRQGHSGRGPTASAAEAPDGARSGRGPTCAAQRALPNVRCPTCASYHLYRFPRRGLQTKGRRCNSKAPSWKAQGKSFLALRERSPAGIQTAPTVKDQSVFIQTRTSAFERQLKNKDNLQ